MSEIEEHIIEQIRARRDAGRAKYGVSMERTDLTPAEWCQHAIEEALDHVIYLEKLRRALLSPVVGEIVRNSIIVDEVQRSFEANRLKKPKRRTPRPRTVADVMDARQSGPSGACCDRYADNKACDCIEIARRTGGTGCNICTNDNCDNPNGKH